ncbi:MAG: hypothetical protein GY762_09400, partial [Proteobacteria bacterium]|nr:hypothetical protein [Pseudomonadota bacterium]
MLKTKIDDGEANAAEVSEYIRLGPEIASKIKDERALITTLEDTAYNMGKRHDIGSAAMYRPYKPKGGSHWVQETFEADWTDTSNPIRTGNMCTDTAKQAHAATPYWKQLFKARPQVAHQVTECLNLLKNGNRVHAPAASMCGKDITTKEIAEICKHLPTGKSPGPDRIPNKFYKHLSKVIAPIIAA